MLNFFRIQFIVLGLMIVSTVPSIVFGVVCAKLTAMDAGHVVLGATGLWMFSVSLVMAFVVSSLAASVKSQNKDR